MSTTAHYYIGTSGWSYPSGFGSWKGIFYPRRWGGDELGYYAERFPAVEVNSSFYRVPAAEVARGWARRTPEAFKFTVKLFRKFTHPEMFAREENASPEITAGDVAGMRQVLDALAEQGKLGALLLQYADFFTNTEEHTTALVRTLDAFRTYPLAVELRHPGWRQPSTAEILAHFRAAYVRIDEPFFANIDNPALPNDELQYWRFHGRNTEQWRTPGAGNQRYDYLYSEDEIDELAKAIRRYVTPDGSKFVFFNNHPGGKAATNALELASRLHLPLPFSKFANLANTFPELRPLTGGEGGQLGLPE